MSAGNTKAKIDAEIAKCEVVCANCHRVRTDERRKAKGIVHDPQAELL